MKTISVQYKASTRKPDREIPAATANDTFHERTNEAGIQIASTRAINIVFIKWMLASFLVWRYTFHDEKGAEQRSSKASNLDNGQDFFLFFLSL